MSDASAVIGAPERLRGWARATAGLSLTAATVVAAGLFLPSSNRAATGLVAILAFVAFVAFVASAGVLVRGGLYNPPAVSEEANNSDEAYANEILPTIRKYITVGSSIGAGAGTALVAAVLVSLLTSPNMDVKVWLAGSAPSACPDLPTQFNATTTRQDYQADGQLVRLEVTAQLCGHDKTGDRTIWLPRANIALDERD